MSNLILPSIVDRMKAVLTDGLFIVAMMFLTTYIFEKLGNVEDAPRFYVFIFLFLIYEPLMTLFGGTIGHRVVGIRVRRANNLEKNIFIPAAIFRFIFKVGLGWISLITVASNSKSLAIHDLVSGSIVVYKDKQYYPENTSPEPDEMIENSEILDAG